MNASSAITLRSSRWKHLHHNKRYRSGLARPRPAFLNDAVMTTRKKRPSTRTSKRNTPERERAVYVMKAPSSSKNSTRSKVKFAEHFKMPKRTNHKRGWQLDRVHEAAMLAFPPDGIIPVELSHVAVLQRIAAVFKQKGWRVPGVDTIRRYRASLQPHPQG